MQRPGKDVSNKCSVKLLILVMHTIYMLLYTLNAMVESGCCLFHMCVYKSVIYCGFMCLGGGIVVIVNVPNLKLQKLILEMM